jgi:hypothetical protein
LRGEEGDSDSENSGANAG